MIRQPDGDFGSERWERTAAVHRLRPALLRLLLLLLPLWTAPALDWFAMGAGGGLQGALPLLLAQVVCWPCSGPGDCPTKNPGSRKNILAVKKIVDPVHPASQGTGSQLH
mgnify:FL=1